MKKQLVLGITGMIMLLALSGCGSSKYVKLCKYKGIEATKVTFDVKDEEIEENVLERMYDNATYNPITDRGVKVGDYVVLDYKATIDGKNAEEYSGEGEEILAGSAYIYPEVEEAIVGMKNGESKTVEFELTSDYAEEGDVGKTVSMEVTVKEITEEVVPEYNEEYVKENTDYDSIKDYEAAVKKEMLAEKEEEYKYVTVEEVLEHIVEKSQFNGYPKEVYEKCEKVYDSTNEMYASMFGMEVADYLEMNGIDEAAKKEQIEEMVYQELVIMEIAANEKLTCTEEETTKYIEDNYEDWGYESVDDFFKEYSKEEVMDDLIYQKVADFLYKNAKYKEISEKEYLESEEDADDEYTDDEDTDYEDAAAEYDEE